MKINVIKPYVKLITPLEELENTVRFLEQAGRTCYKSEKKDYRR